MTAPKRMTAEERARKLFPSESAIGRLERAYVVRMIEEAERDAHDAAIEEAANYILMLAVKSNSPESLGGYAERIRRDLKSNSATTAPRAAEEKSPGCEEREPQIAPAHERTQFSARSDRSESSPTLTEQRVREIAAEVLRNWYAGHDQTHIHIDDRLAKLDARIEHAHDAIRAIRELHADGTKSLSGRIGAVAKRHGDLAERIAAVEWVNEKVPRESPAPPPDEVERIKDEIVRVVSDNFRSYVPTKDLTISAWKGWGNTLRDLLDRLDAARAPSKEKA